MPAVPKLRPVSQHTTSVFLRPALWLSILILTGLACNLVARPTRLEATLTAVYVQQTSLAITAEALSAFSSLPQTATPASIPAPTTTPLPPAAAATPAPGETSIASDPIDADERLMKSAHILLFEDMSASRYIRLVKEALDRMDYFYLDVGSAKGWFKTQMLSNQSWDLVIASAEADREFGGEFFQYLDDQLGRGAAVILENWDLDAAPQGQARLLLDHCGVQVASDWFEPELRVFFWTDPAHPIFNQPNPLPGGLRNAAKLWSGDLGDLLEVKLTGGQLAGGAQILASSGAVSPDDHGLLAVCMNGRMVLQTFRSHEYHHDDIVALWQNYIDYTLRSHFAYTGQTLPTPAVTLSAKTPLTPEITRGATPGPDYSFPHVCGAELNARLTRAPQFQQDLFEHHAVGKFLILRVEIQNTGANPVQIWDGDYLVEGSLYGKPVTYPLQRAATGYLFIDMPSHLYQDLIQPGEKWNVNLVFDVDPAAQDLAFRLRPGQEFNETVCDVRIPLK